MTYYFTGEEVPSGVYSCTFCSSQIALADNAVLPLCPICDSAEFIRIELDDSVQQLDSSCDQGV